MMSIHRSEEMKADYQLDRGIAKAVLALQDAGVHM
jgi:hypothetical protein